MTETTTVSRSRARLGALAGVTIVLGLATRREPQLFPGLVVRYGGDVVWATLVYWLVACVRPPATRAQVGVITFAFAVAVEVSQLSSAAWLVALRGTMLGALVLGQGFLWSDLVCYGLGVLLGMTLDQGWLRKRG